MQIGLLSARRRRHEVPHRTKKASLDSVDWVREILDVEHRAIVKGQADIAEILVATFRGFAFVSLERSDNVVERFDSIASRCNKVKIFGKRNVVVICVVRPQNVMRVVGENHYLHRTSKPPALVDAVCRDDAPDRRTIRGWVSCDRVKLYPFAPPPWRSRLHFCMAEPLFTGERFLPGCTGEIAYEHWHRYAFARQFVLGKRVLDAACGEGYGAALLGEVAASVVGVDIDADAIAQASSRYALPGRVSFVEGSCTSLAFPDASFDLVVSFETIEHLTSADQPRMLDEFARVLKRDGLLVVSSPNKRLYSDARNYVNEFHLHELYRAGLFELLGKHFPAQRWHHQGVSSWSGIWAEGSGTGVEAWLGDADRVEPYAPPEGMYFIVVAARSESALPESAARGSLFTDADQTEQKRNEANAREVLRLDALLKEWDATVGKQAAHIHHLESLVADTDRRLFELNAVREKQVAQLEARVAEVLGTLATEQKRLEAELTAQQRIIAYRQSARWWLQLPWLRMRLWFSRSR